MNLTKIDIETVQDIYQAIQDVFGYNKTTLENMIKKKSRKKEVVAVRHIYRFLLNKNTKLSLKQIGKLSGGADHTTVLHSVGVINTFLSYPNKDQSTYITPVMEGLKKIINKKAKNYEDQLTNNFIAGLKEILEIEVDKELEVKIKVKSLIEEFLV